MSENDACLQEHELLIHLSGSEQNPAWDTHLNECDRCRTRRERLQKEIEGLKKALGNHDDPSATVAFHPTGPSSAGQEMPAAFGKYQVLDVLGMPGGQAIVYRAYDGGLGRNVAVKVPRRPLRGAPAKAAELEAMARRLKEESRILAQLDHPGIAKVFDGGVQDGCPYLVMELVSGRTLGEYVKGRRLPCAEAAELVAQVAEALACAHSLGVTHLDVKPSNIMVQENGKVKVIDFGLARLEQSADDLAIGGTPQYMSVEQALGRSDSIGPSSDQFSAGAVLYELLTGSPAYAAETWQKRLEKAAEGRFDAEALRRCGAPRGLVAVCLKAMGKKPQDRFGGCTELAAALRKAVRPARWPLPVAVVTIIVLVSLGLAMFANRGAATPRGRHRSTIAGQAGSRMLCRMRRPGTHESCHLQVLHGDGRNRETGDRHADVCRGCRHGPHYQPPIPLRRARLHALRLCLRERPRTARHSAS
jgi:tRNA A-37 threonylcarbamoyl transferase component Bud32